MAVEPEISQAIWYVFMGLQRVTLRLWMGQPNCRRAYELEPTPARCYLPTYQRDSTCLARHSEKSEIGTKTFIVAELYWAGWSPGDEGQKVFICSARS